MRVNSAIKKDLDSVSVKLDLASAKVDSLARQTNQLKKGSGNRVCFANWQTHC